MRNKKLLKKMVLCVTMLIMCFSLVACSPVTLSTMQNKEGQIRTELTVDVSSLSPSEKSTAFTIMKDYSAQLKSEFEKNLIKIFDNIYSFKDLGLFTNFDKTSYIVQRNSAFLIGNVEFLPSVFDSKTKTLTAGITFKSIFGYLMFFCPKAIIYNNETKNIELNGEVYQTLVDAPIPSNGFTKEDYLMVYKYIQTSKPFSYNLEEPYFFEDVQFKHYKNKKVVDVAVSELGLNESEAQFVYNFLTPYSRFHSDSDKVVKNGNYYIHSWNFGNDINSLIKVWRTGANYLWWYLFPIIITLVIIGISVAICFIRKKKKNKKNLQTLEKIDELVTIAEREEYENELKDR